MTTKTSGGSDNNMNMLLIVALVGAILYMLTKKSGGICSLVNPKETFVLGAPLGCAGGRCGGKQARSSRPCRSLRATDCHMAAGCGWVGGNDGFCRADSAQTKKFLNAAPVRF
jgi:hypothetical protein